MRNRRIWYYLKSYKFNSIFLKNFLVIALLVIVPISFIGILFYSYMEKTLQQEVHSINESYTYRTRDVVDTILKESRTLVLNTTLNQDVQNYMLFNNANLFFANFETRISSLIKSYTLVFKYFNSVYIYSEKSGGLITNRYTGNFENFTDKNWIRIYESSTKDEVIIKLSKTSDTKKNFISITKVYFDDGVKMGAVAVNISIEEVLKIINSYNDFKDQTIILSDGHGNVMLSNHQEFIGKNVNETKFLQYTDGEKYIHSSADSTVFDLKYQTFMPEGSYKDKFTAMRKLLVLTICICGVLILFVTYSISLRTYKPMREILSTIDQPDQFLENYPGTSPEKLDEMRYIINNIKKMMVTNRDIRSELGKHLRMLKKAHYAMLQSQINPHFLYNTLESINWIVRKRIGYENEVSETIDTLANIFRLSTENENYLISLEQEIEYTKNYIDILKIRYRDVFDVVWNVDRSLAGCKVVKLCMQPIIENAVYHGIKEKDEKGTIQITIVKQEASCLIIQIADDGVGIQKERLMKIQNKLAQSIEDRPVNDGKHIGMINVDERIKILFGNEHGVSVGSEEGAGTTVNVKIPLVNS